MAYNKKNWMKQKEEEKKQWAKDAVENIKLYERKPEDVKEYLNFMSRMHNYSPRNTASIHAQFPGAGFVASKDKYRELGFEILPDQKGIDIMVPTPVKYFKDENGKQKQVKYATQKEKQLIADDKLPTTQKTFYSLKPVYDVTQTNAKPEDYPKIYPNGRVEFDVTDKQVVKNILLATERFVESKGIPVRSENYSQIGMGAAKGYFSPDANRISLNQLNTDTENMTVLIHETAHATMHKENSKMIDTPVKEFEAELTSYIVNKHFGIDTSAFSNEYIAQWTQNLTNVKDVESSLKNISRATTEIIEGIEENLELEQEIIRERKMDQTLEDRNEIRLTLSDYKYNDYMGMMETYNDFFKEKFKTDNIQIKQGTEMELPGQKDSSYTDRSYLVIENQSNMTGKDLEALQYNAWKDIALAEGERSGKDFNISAMYLVVAEDDHLTIENSIAKSTDLSLKGLTGEKLEFYKKAIEVFDHTNNGMTIDNLDVETNEPMSFEDFRNLHEEIDEMLKDSRETDYNAFSKKISSERVHNLDIPEDVKRRDYIINEMVAESQSLSDIKNELESYYGMPSDEQIKNSEKLNRAYDRSEEIDINLTILKHSDVPEYYQQVLNVDKAITHINENYPEKAGIELETENLNDAVIVVYGADGKNNRLIDINSLKSQEMKRDIPSEKLEVLGGKIGIDKEGIFNQPIIHLPDEDRVTTLKAFSSELNRKNNQLDHFKYEIYTKNEEPLFKGVFSKDNDKSFIDTIKLDAEKNNKTNELNEGFKQIREIGQRQDRGKGMELTKNPRG